MLKHKDVLGLFELDAEENDEILTVGMSMKKLLPHIIVVRSSRTFAPLCFALSESRLDNTVFTL